MKRVITAAIGFATLVMIAMVYSQTAWAAEASSQQSTADAKKPADRVVVMYFHRTQRCPTCLRMGGYTEEAVLEGFPKEIEAGTVEFHYVDFQNPKNAAIVKGYKIGGPTLMVVKVAENKAVAAKNLTEIWTKNRDKEVFLQYVRDNVRASQKPLTKSTAGASRADTSSRR